MKKLTAVLCTLAMLTEGISAAAADTSAASQLEAAVTEQLISYGYDTDDNGDISAEELSEIQFLYLDLTDVADISFLSQMQQLQSVQFENGNITDLSLLTTLPKLYSLSLYNMYVDDLTFLKNMNLEYCSLEDVDARIGVNKLDLLQLQDYTYEKGYAEQIEIKPYGLFESEEFEIIIDNHDVIFEDDEYGTQSETQDIYTIAEGESNYHVLLNGNEIYQGKITVKPQNLTQEPIENDIISWANYSYLDEPADAVDALVGSRMYRIENGDVTLLKEGVSDLYSIFLDSLGGSSSFHYAELELDEDGSLFVDGNQVFPEEHFVSIRENCAMTSDHKLYAVYYEKNQYIWVQISDACEEILVSEYFPIFRGTDGDIYAFSVNSTQRTATVTHTEMATPVQYFYDYMLDENHVSWYISRNNIQKVAEKVVSFGIYETSEGKHSGYITEDGLAFLLNSNQTPVTIYETESCEMQNDMHDTFFFHDWYESGEKSEAACGGKWRLSSDGILTIAFEDQRFAINNSANVLSEGYNEAENRHYVFFARKDASVWRYCIESGTAEKYIEGEVTYKPGDTNGDGRLTISDVVLFSRYVNEDPVVISKQGLVASDMDNSQTYTLDDVNLMLRKIARLD